MRTIGEMVQSPEDQNRYQAMVALMAGVKGEVGTLNALMARWLPRAVVFSGTVVLDSSGAWSLDFPEPTRAIFVDNPAASQVVVVAANRGASAPGFGNQGANIPGAHLINAYAARAINAVTNVWSIYGTAGAEVSVQVFGHYIEPAGSSQPASLYDVFGRLEVNSRSSQTSASALTNVASAAASTQLLAANPNRSGAIFWNDSTAVLYLALAAAASTTSYTVQLAAQGSWTLPPSPVYTGAIFGIWASANGYARVTELS